jgi:hypothetical protein
VSLKTTFLAIAIVAALSTSSGAQPLNSRDLGRTGEAFQPREIVDLPTAGLPPRGGFYVESDVYSEGAMLVSLGVGFTRYFSFGISYGGQGIIGSGDPDMNPEPGVHLKARLVNETVTMPAIAVGFDSQGRGPYIDELDRYVVKSRGIFAVASKNWEIVGPLSLHGGISYSLESEDDNDPDIFFGFIKTFSGFLDLRAEYDFGLNDNEGDEPFVEKRGFLNASVVWHVNEDFAVALEVRDIATEERPRVEDLRQWNRGLSIIYTGML